MSAMLQFANYPEQQPGSSSIAWTQRREGATAGQPRASKKPPRAVGEVRKLEQAMPPAELVEPLDEIYVWDDRPSVLRFVEENHLRGLLLEARQALDRAFGNEAIKTLSLVRDDEGFDTLFCLIRTRSELEVATRALQEFDERWWLQRSAEAHGNLNFDFDLV